MNWQLFMHAVGIACLGTIFAIALHMLADAIVPSWSRIWPRALGRIIVDDRPAPRSPTASTRPLRVRHPQLRAVEADAQPTRRAA